LYGIFKSKGRKSFRQLIAYRLTASDRMFANFLKNEPHMQYFRVILKVHLEKIKIKKIKERASISLLKYDEVYLRLLKIIIFAKLGPGI